MTAASGAAAIELARTRRPAIIVMDIQMGGMAGTEAMQVLHSIAASFDRLGSINPTICVPEPMLQRGSIGIGGDAAARSGLIADCHSDQVPLRRA